MGSTSRSAAFDVVTGPELAQIFSQVLQRDLTYYQMSPEEMGAVIDGMFGPGAGQGVAEAYRKEQNDPNPPPSYHDMSVVLDKLPVPMTSIRDWLARHASAFAAVTEVKN